MSQTLYYNIIYNISKAIKFSLNEAILNFNPSEYTEDELDVIDNQTINDILEFDYNTFNEMAKIFLKLKIPKKLKPFFIPFFNIYKQDKGYYQNNNEWSVEYVLRLDNDKLPSFYNIKDIVKKQDISAVYKLEIEFRQLIPYAAISDEKRRKCILFINDFLVNDMENNIINKNNNLYYNISPYLSYTSYFKVICIYVPANKINVILDRDKVSKNSLITNINDGLCRIEEFLNRYIMHLLKNIDKIKKF